MAKRIIHRNTRTDKLLKSALLERRKEKNIRNITVKELCEKAHLNRSTFYLHYKKPEDVLIEREEDALSKLEQDLKKQDSKQDSMKLWTILLENIKEYKEFYYLLFTQKEEHHFLLRRQKYYLQSPKERLLSDEKRNDYRNNYRIAGNLSILVSWLTDGCRIPTEVIARLRNQRQRKISTRTDQDLEKAKQ